MQRWMMIPALSLVAASPALADWTGKAEAGLVVASGNTEAQSLNGKFQFTNELEKWKHQFGAAALHASDDEGTTADRWEVSGQSDYNFSPRTFWFGAGRYEQDRFSGFEYQATLSTGLGRKFVDSATTKFNGTVGVGYKVFETSDSFDEATGVRIAQGETQSQAVLRGTLDFEHQFNAATTLLDRFIVEAGADNTSAQNDLSLQVKMTDVLALAVGYQVKHNTDPPLGFEKTDTLSTVNLVYLLK
jgi:putative salt-induced outer membrane protein